VADFSNTLPSITKATIQNRNIGISLMLPGMIAIRRVILARGEACSAFSGTDEILSATTGNLPAGKICLNAALPGNQVR
jgi:hypothetical protein